MATYDLTMRLAQIAEHEGRRDMAAFLYAEVLCGYPQLIEAWWGLSQTIDDTDQIQYCLGRVLAIKPYYSHEAPRLKEQARQLLLPPGGEFGPWPKVDRRRRPDRRRAV